MTQSARKAHELHVLWPLVAMSVGGAYGAVASFVPSPHSPDMFWVGNTVAPWLMIAFWGGNRIRSLLAGAFAGAVANVSAVIAFYARGFADAPPAPFMYKWMIIATVVGSVIGMLGAYRRRSATSWPLLALAAAVGIEPFWHIAVQGYALPSPAVWMVHVLIALAITAYARYATRDRASAKPGVFA